MLKANWGVSNSQRNSLLSQATASASAICDPTKANPTLEGPWEKLGMPSEALGMARGRDGSRVDTTGTSPCQAPTMPFPAKWALSKMARVRQWQG